jgi:hypothetical protein
MSKEVQDIEVTKNVIRICLLEQRRNFAVDYLEKGATIMAKYCVALLNKLKQQLVSKRRDKLSKGISFQDNAVLHKAAIMHQKLANLHFEVLKHPAYSPDLAPSY